MKNGIGFVTSALSLLFALSIPVMGAINGPQCPSGSYYCSAAGSCVPNGDACGSKKKVRNLPLNQIFKCPDKQKLKIIDQGTEQTFYCEPEPKEKQK